MPPFAISGLYPHLAQHRVSQQRAHTTGLVLCLDKCLAAAICWKPAAIRHNRPQQQHAQQPSMHACLQYKAKRNALYDPDASDEEGSIKASNGKKRSKQTRHKPEQDELEQKGR